MIFIKSLNAQVELKTGGSYIATKQKTILVRNEFTGAEYESNFDQLDLASSWVSNDSTDFNLTITFSENSEFIIDGEIYKYDNYAIKNDTIYFRYVDGYGYYGGRPEYAVTKENAIEIAYHYTLEMETGEFLFLDFRAYMPFKKDVYYTPPPRYHLDDMVEVAGAEITPKQVKEGENRKDLPLQSGGSYIGVEIIFSGQMGEDGQMQDLEKGSKDINLYLTLEENGSLTLNGTPVNNVSVSNDTIFFSDISIGPYELRQATSSEEGLELTLIEPYMLYKEDEYGIISEEIHETTYMVPLTFNKNKYYKASNKTVDSLIVTEIPVLPTGSYFSNFERDEDPYVKDSLNADIVLWGYMGGDGMRMVRNKETKKWGIYQVMGYSAIYEFIPMDYDSLQSFEQNEWFTAVYNNGKVGFYLAAWSFGDDAKQTVPCEYDAYKIFETNDYPPVPYLAVKKDGKWAWVDWLTGELKCEFIDKLTSIPFEQKLSYEDK